MNELDQCRKEIDEIDNELIALFERRLDVAARVAEYKKNNNIPIYNEERESQVIEKNVGKLINKKYDILSRRFLINLMELSRSLQESIIRKRK